MQLCERRKNLIKLPTQVISEVINIDFRRIWHFDVKGTMLVGLQLSVILTQTVGRFNMCVNPNAKLKIC